MICLNRQTIREALMLFAVQVLQYSVVCFSYRTLAQANIPLSVATDLFYAFLMFTVIRRVANASNAKLSQLFYALGSAVGTWIGIAVSLKVLGK